MAEDRSNEEPVTHGVGEQVAQSDEPVEATPPVKMTASERSVLRFRLANEFSIALRTWRLTNVDAINRLGPEDESVLIHEAVNQAVEHIQSPPGVAVEPKVETKTEPKERKSTKATTAE